MLQKLADRSISTSDIVDMLRGAGLRPTRQRVSLAALLFSQGDRHTTAENLYEEAHDAGVRISLATIYNALHQFTEAGLLRELAVDGTRTYFDTNTGDHQHFFIESEGEMIDIPAPSLKVTGIPDLPRGKRIDRVDVMIRLIDDE
ncbi:Iron-responsive regulator Irr [hydrothermal vent metagenome]|uniref:Iron-responsive regulator Irr n=1 Tax=hydrothermal vent metagenome TaxID=652676 RepID=A0A3B0TQK0_9ZZZZ